MPRLISTFLLAFLLLESTTAPGHARELKHGYKVPASFQPQMLYSEGHAAPDGVVVMGDMLVPQNLYQMYFNSSSASSRKGVISDYLWPEEEGVPTIPYEFEDARYRTEIEAGMKHWEEHTCLTFRPKEVRDTNWLRFIYGEGCWSYVGKQPMEHQAVSIGEHCQWLRTVVHELGHAIGLFHEQSRSDRDDYVVINWKNIVEDKIDQFYKRLRLENNYGIPYDYTSIMHYDGREFSNNGRTSIATKQPEHQGLVGRSQELTHRDKHIVNIMYGCIDTWRAQCSSTTTCEGEGYLGRYCQCVCPPGREGDRCEVIKSDYYAESLPACSRTINAEGNFTSHTIYPQNIPHGTWCVYTVEAPENMVPEVIFHSFSFFTLDVDFDWCFDFLEVRDSNPYEGGLYCGNDIKEGQSFVSNSRHMYLYLDAKYTPLSQGFLAEVVFHNDSTSNPPYTSTSDPPYTSKSDPPTCPSEGVRELVPSTVMVLVAILVAQVYRKL